MSMSDQVLRHTFSCDSDLHSIWAGFVLWYYFFIRPTYFHLYQSILCNIYLSQLTS